MDMACRTHRSPLQRGRQVHEHGHLSRPHTLERAEAYLQANGEVRPLRKWGLRAISRAISLWEGDGIAGPRRLLARLDRHHAVLALLGHPDRGELTRGVLHELLGDRPVLHVANELLGGGGGPRRRQEHQVADLLRRLDQIFRGVDYLLHQPRRDGPFGRDRLAGHE